MSQLKIYLVILEEEGICYHASKPYQTLRGAKKELARLSKESANAKIIYANEWKTYREEEDAK